MLFFVKQANGKGRIKEKPEDFLVEEITKEGEVLEVDKKIEKKDEEGDFIVFVLQKKLWNTYQALLKISKVLGRGKKAFGFAGTKDRKAITTQLASFYKVEKERLLSIKIKDIKINGAWRSKNCIRLGDLLGNRFEIFVKTNDISDVLSTLNEFKNLQKFPNYFGPQRFGSRGNNFEIGLKLLNREFEPAAIEFLCSIKNETNAQAIEARKKLSEEMDFKKALEYFPMFLKYERKMLNFLSRQPRNFIGAFRTLPRNINLMFIHSVQAELFNEVLEKKVKEGSLEKEKIRCEANFYGFPDTNKISEKGIFPLGNLIGYKSMLDSYEEEALKKYSISKEDFLFKEFPEISQKGKLRALVAPVKELEIKEKENGISFCFSLPNGSYATVFLSQFFKELVA
ncbi:MAG: tRNA pseudouridine(13) synthase TruD [Candidatus Micrarchaeia archaeon]